MATEKLLEEFPPVSTQSWEDAIHKDLKGADYAKKLIWQSEEGLAVKPYYRAEDIAGLEFTTESLALATSDNSPFARDSHVCNDWRIREEIDAINPEQANQAALGAVAAGAEELSFLNVVIRDASDLELLLVNLQEIPVHFQNVGETLIPLLVRRLQDRPESSTISTGLNPLTNPDFTASLINSARPKLVPFAIDGSAFEESGATAVQEIGFALAAGVDFLAEMESRNVALGPAAASLEFAFSIGANYFFQIAKFRAFRLLWARVVESFGAQSDGAPARIHARTSRWNKTIYDPHVNILRATTEAMSAALGGADSISVAAFDECYKSPDEASRRLARNTQIILKHEAFLSNVADPGAGSYCLEVFTDFIAREAWKLMQGAEVSGGFQKMIADGQLAKTLQLSMTARDKAVSSRRRVFTGTNQYANASEKILDRVEPLRLSSVRRGAQSFEAIRLSTERHEETTGFLPRVLLAEIGDVKMRSARSAFAANFFACAGFDVITQRFNCAAEIAGVNAELIVLCSSDPEYLGLVMELVPKANLLGRKTPLLVAGNPESAEQLRAAGVTDFINIRSNPIDVLTNWQQQLGIKV